MLKIGLKTVFLGTFSTSDFSLFGQSGPFFAGKKTFKHLKHVLQNQAPMKITKRYDNDGDFDNYYVKNKQKKYAFTITCQSKSLLNI